MQVLQQLRAHLSSEHLDRRLLAGEDPAGDPVLAERSARLTEPACRRELAAGLEEAIEAAHPPHLRAISSAIMVEREEVLRAEPELRQLVERLRDQHPIEPLIVARVRALLVDGSSPLYQLAEPGDLRAWAQRTLEETQRT